jgi:hypothetical protein
MGSQRAALIGELWFNNYASIGSNGELAAAFQAAVWEIINGDVNHLNITTGSFLIFADSMITNTANLWLSQLDLSGRGSTQPGLEALVSASTQDYVVQGPTGGGGGEIVPAPSSWVLCLIGIGSLAAVAVVRWRNGVSFGAI